MKVAVIGAGPAGLAVQKELRETGHDAVYFEGTCTVMVKFKLASLLHWLGRRYRFDSTW